MLGSSNFVVSVAILLDATGSMTAFMKEIKIQLLGIVRQVGEATKESLNGLK
jgi:hypothetical protein